MLNSLSHSTLHTAHSRVPLAALILAGGKSSRMGKDKALIVWEGIPMLQRVCRVAAECGAVVYILTPWVERYQGIVKQKCFWLVETQPHQGPLVALAQGLAAISAEWVLLLACDMPLLQVDILKGWVQQLSEVSEEILAVVPRHSFGWEPLCGFYRARAQENLQDFIAQGERSLQRWLARLPVKPLSVGTQEAQMLYNCNTPEDL